MFSKKTAVKCMQLVLCNSQINSGYLVFLDIGNHHPVSLFSISSHSAVIKSESEVIFINRYSVINCPHSSIEAVYLPDDEKTSSVACCRKFVVVLSSNGRIFSLSILLKQTESSNFQNS